MSTLFSRSRGCRSLDGNLQQVSASPRRVLDCASCIKLHGDLKSARLGGAGLSDVEYVWLLVTDKAEISSRAFRVEDDEKLFNKITCALLRTTLFCAAERNSRQKPDDTLSSSSSVQSKRCPTARVKSFYQLSENEKCANIICHD